MEKKMEPIEVKITKDGMIDILQDYGYGPEDVQVVRLHPAQVDTLIEWLKDSKKELMHNSPVASAKA